MEKTIITIGRQYGSGGREIGQKLAKLLNIEYYDKELLVVAAKKSGLSTQFLDSYDEKQVNSLLFSLVMGDRGIYPAGAGISVEQMASQAQREAVISVADQGSCVIVGRCADYILKGREGLTRVFICADWEKRVERVCKRENLSEKAAAEKIRRMDKARNSYYSYHTDQKWSEAGNYDLCINASRKSVDEIVDLIARFAH